MLFTFSKNSSSQLRVVTSATMQFRTKRAGININYEMITYRLKMSTRNVAANPTMESAQPITLTTIKAKLAGTSTVD